ncbi:hypothetical protein IscW_ISCW005406, partial [Ixodes scapularis]
SVVNDIKRKFREHVVTASWMDDETRKGALNKLDNTEIFTGYPNHLSDEEGMNKRYGE